MKKISQSLGILLIAIVGVALVFLFQNLFTAGSLLQERVTSFTTILLGIFIEAIPFLLLGSLASGLVEVFANRDMIHRLSRSNPVLGALGGSLMGLLFPVCECGVVPLTRRLFKKGLPPAIGVAFLLSTPILNPIVIVSTYSAFGWGPVLWLRIGLSILISFSVGLIFSVQKQPWKLMHTSAMAPILGGSMEAVEEKPASSLWQKMVQVLQITVEEFFDMGRYLVIGAIMAALMQTIVPQQALLSLGQGNLSSILVMIVLAVVLSICSTVDAFFALSFVGSFTTGSILAFLVFGPMVDIKSTLMYLHVFNKKTVVYLVTLPLLFTILATLILNYWVF